MNMRKKYVKGIIYSNKYGLRLRLSVRNGAGKSDLFTSTTWRSFSKS